MLPFTALSASEITAELAARVRALRLQRGWTQVEAAARAAMSHASYKRFERTGEIALHSLVQIAIALGQASALSALFLPAPAQTLEEATRTTRPRMRAPRCTLARTSL